MSHFHIFQFYSHYFRSFVFTPTCPFRQLTLTLSPCPGTAFWLHTSISPTSENSSRFIFFPFFLVSGAACAFVFLFYCREIFILRNKKDPFRGLFVISHSDRLECVVQFNAPSIFRIFVHAFYISGKAIVSIEFEVLLESYPKFSLPESYVISCS